MVKPFCCCLILIFCRVELRAQEAQVPRPSKPPAANPHTARPGYAIIKALVYEDQQNDLRFPFIILKDTAVANEINSYLQEGVVGVQSIRTSGKGLFAHHKWTPAGGGMDQLDYSVLVNTNRVISLELTGEEIGVHPSPFQQYFQFNLRDGQPITLDQLIKQESKKELENDIRRKRATLIAAHLEELKKDTAAAEDLDLIGKRFNEDNEEVDLGQFSIRPTGIRFYSSFHLPHVMQEWDTDLGVDYSFQQLSPWMDDFGKELLLKP